MSNALAIASGGLRAQEYYIDKIAHDLANLNTSNYKASKMTFADQLYQNINGGSSLQAKANLQLGMGASIYKTGKDFSEGPLKPTNNWSDLAIDGPGFFQVSSEDGTISYTRNSTFIIDEDHYLATQDGSRLSDNIQIPEDAIEITIQKEGEVLARVAGDTEPQLLGSIKLAKFLDPDSLHSIGSGLYKTTELSGEPIVDSPASSGLGSLAQKQIEGSNVDMVSSLMQLTMAQRIYQLNAKAVQIADELEKITNEIRN
ncbi:MAG: flagellar hook-basal body complex protein [Tatlockia sp.]|nr:flagellar hook-basal body complex protein [Tatlockia sp.]